MINGETVLLATLMHLLGETNVTITPSDVASMTSQYESIERVESPDGSKIHIQLRPRGDTSLDLLRD